MNDAELARLLLLIADKVLDRPSVASSAGAVRQAARRIVELSELVDGRSSDGCEACGKVLTRKATGRPARFCSSRCRTAAHRVTKAVS